MKKLPLLLIVIILITISAIACGIKGNLEFAQYAETLKILDWLPFGLSIFLSIILTKSKNGEYYFFRSMALVIVPWSAIWLLSMYYEIGIRIMRVIIN